MKLKDTLKQERLNKQNLKSYKLVLKFREFGEINLVTGKLIPYKK